MKKISFDVIVIGAGASGLMAAVVAAENGANVLLLEQKEQVGKKLLATGNGKCNFTNKDMDVSHYYGDLTLVEAVLEQFGKEETLQFFHGLFLYPKEKNGCYYPNSGQASSVVAAFLRRVERSKNIRLITSARVADVKTAKSGFCVLTHSGETYRGRTLVISCGLLAAPKLGSDGSLFAAVKGLGHHFSAIVPALCGFYCKGADFKRISGVRVPAAVSILVDGKIQAKDAGELQFTDYGISGIPVFQVSRVASMALYENKKVEARLSFLPEISDEALRNELDFRKKAMGSDPDAGLLCSGLLPEKLSRELVKQSAGDLLRLQEFIRSFTVTVVQARDYEFAQVCAGGIRREEIDKKTLESALVPGLYFSGEILDVDGICGGYNLQWAWSSGYTAGKNAAGRAVKND